MIANIEGHGGTSGSMLTPTRQRLGGLRQRVSASRLSLWLQCRMRFFFRYVTQIRKAPTPGMHAGAVVHSALQSWNLSRWRGEGFSLEHLRASFAAQWSALHRESTIAWEGEEESQRDASWRVLETYFLQAPVPANEKPEAVEVTVEADLAEKGLPRLVGILDLVRAGSRIVEYKLTGKTPDPVQLVQVHELQLTCYSVLFRHGTGRAEAALELHHLVRTRKPAIVINVLPPSSDRQHSRLFRQMESYVGGLDRQDFVPSPGFHCAGCEYFAECRLLG